MAPSCRPAGISSQRPPRAGSHLYSAQQDSARSRTLSEEAYGLSWVSPSPLRSLGLCSPSLISVLIIAQAACFVKTFFVVGENFFSPLPQCGCVAPALRIIWHTAPRLDFGERTPAGPIAPVIRLLCRVSGPSRLARLPLRRAFGFHLYTAAQGGSPSYSATMVDGLSFTRWWFQRPTCARFWGHRAPPALPPGKPPAAGVRFPSPFVSLL